MQMAETVEQHRVFGFSGYPFQQFNSLLEETRRGIIESDIQIGLRLVAHRQRKCRRQVLGSGRLSPRALRQHLFVARPKVEPILRHRLARDRFRLVDSAEAAQNSCFQVVRLGIPGIALDRLLEMFQRGGIVFFQTRDLCQREMRCCLPRIIPSRFAESGARFRKPVLIFQGQAQVVVRFTVAWVRISFREPLDGTLEEAH